MRIVKKLIGTNIFTTPYFLANNLQLIKQASLELATTAACQQLPYVTHKKDS
jgi:hypothetical protein